MSHHSLMDFFMMLMISITIILIAATRKKVHQSQKKKKLTGINLHIIEELNTFHAHFIFNPVYVSIWSK